MSIWVSIHIVPKKTFLIFRKVLKRKKGKRRCTILLVLIMYRLIMTLQLAETLLCTCLYSSNCTKAIVNRKRDTLLDMVWIFKPFASGQINKLIWRWYFCWNAWTIHSCMHQFEAPFLMFTPHKAWYIAHQNLLVQFREALVIWRLNCQSPLLLHES